jgi:hypothetical protein
MLTSTELNNILKQVNIAFVELGKRVEKVEARIVALEAGKTAKVPIEAPKKVSV